MTLHSANHRTITTSGVRQSSKPWGVLLGTFLALNTVCGDGKAEPLPAGEPEAQQASAPGQQEEPKAAKVANSGSSAAQSEPGSLSYQAYAVGTEQWLEHSEWFKELSQSRVVCFGETHENATHRSAAVSLLAELARRGIVKGRRLVVVTDAIDSTQQPFVKAFSLGRLSLPELDKTTHGRLRPWLSLLVNARQRGVEIIAIGSAELDQRRDDTPAPTPKTAPARMPPRTLREAWQAKKAEEKRAAEVEATKATSPNTAELTQTLFRARVAAYVSSRFLLHSPAVSVLILAKHEHCAASAIPVWLRSYSPSKVVSVEPLEGSLDSPPANLTFDYAMLLSRESSR